MGEEYASIGVQLGARYDGSPIIAGNGAPPADDYVRYTPSGVPGGRAPHYWLNAGRGYGDSLVRSVGRGLHAAPAGRQSRGRRGARGRAQQRGVPFKVLDVPQADARDLYGADLALVRPDQYVAWRGNAPPADAERLLAQLVGAA